VLKPCKDKLNSDQLLNTFASNDGFNPMLMRDLIKTMLDSAERLGLADIIAERIRKEVSVSNLSQVKESLVADIMASTLNAFVNDFGYSLLTEEQIAKARSIAEDNFLPVFEYIGRERTSTFTHDELAGLFEDAFERGGGLVDSFESHYNEWLEYMTIAFIVHLRRSRLRPEVNKALGDIIDQIQFN
ncbi:MAG: hypothetical protein K2L84_01880, partial [Muribaculaceae bacterium]|nr:hypothetical protein [Muribaculaceae bacterium]